MLGKWRDIPEEFNEWRVKVNNNVRLLVGFLGFDKRKEWDKDHRRLSLQDGDKVSGATFRELLIRNEIQRQQSRIMSRPVAQQNPEDLSGVENLVDATKVICMLTYMACPMFASS